MDATWGMVYPGIQGQMIHNNHVNTWYTRVQVDGVHEAYQNHVLPPSPNEEMTTQYGAKGSFIQWPKENIRIDTPKPTKMAPVFPAETMTRPQMKHILKISTAPAIAPQFDCVDDC
jgi:hypothetical protein